MAIKINLNPSIPPLPSIEDKTKINLRYVLISPYVSVHIYWDSKEGELVYQVEEPKLTHQERNILYGRGCTDVIPCPIRTFHHLDYLVIRSY